MNAPPLQVSMIWNDKDAVIRVQGELDYATAPLLQETLIEALNKNAQNIDLDFCAVTFFDSEGLKVIIRAYKTIQDRGGSLNVLGCNKYVARTFEILGLDKHFGITPGNLEP